MKTQYILISVFIIFLLVFVYVLNAQNIKFKEVGTINSSNHSIEGYVYILKSYEESLVLNKKDFSDLDFTNHNYIITKGWKLKDVSYSNFKIFSKNNARKVKIILYEKDESNNLHIYKIGKQDIYLDEKFSNEGVIFE